MRDMSNISTRRYDVMASRTGISFAPITEIREYPARRGGMTKQMFLASVKGLKIECLENSPADIVGYLDRGLVVADVTHETIVEMAKQNKLDGLKTLHDEAMAVTIIEPISNADECVTLRTSEFIQIISSITHDETVLKYLYDLDILSENDISALYVLAILHRELSIIKYLQSINASVANACDEYTAIELAAVTGDIDVFKYIQNVTQEVVDISIMRYAGMADYPTIVEYLLSDNPAWKHMLWEELDQAIVAGNDELVDYYIANLELTQDDIAGLVEYCRDGDIRARLKAMQPVD